MPEAAKQCPIDIRVLLVFSLKNNEKYQERKLAKKLHDHSWFMGFAPVEQPKIAIAIILENSKGSPEIARKIFDQYLLNLKN